MVQGRGEKEKIVLPRVDSKAAWTLTFMGSDVWEVRWGGKGATFTCPSELFTRVFWRCDSSQERCTLILPTCV